MTHNSRGLSELDLEELTGGYVLLPSLAGSCSTSIKVLIMKEMASTNRPTSEHMQQRSSNFWAPNTKLAVSE